MLLNCPTTFQDEKSVAVFVSQYFHRSASLLPCTLPWECCLLLSRHCLLPLSESCVSTVVLRDGRRSSYNRSENLYALHDHLQTQCLTVKVKELETELLEEGVKAPYASSLTKQTLDPASRRAIVNKLRLEFKRSPQTLFLRAIF